MKNLTRLLALISGVLIITSVYAGDNASSLLKAQKVCSPQIDIFNTDNVESVLAIANGEKIASYEVVLALPEQEANKEGNFAIYKYSTQYGDFKKIMSEIKKHATTGSILFIDEIKSASGNEVANAQFYLR